MRPTTSAQHQEDEDSDVFLDITGDQLLHACNADLSRHAIQSRPGHRRANPSGRSISSCSYSYATRRRFSSPQKLPRTQRWTAQVDVMKEAKLRRNQCYKKHHCFRRVDLEHFITQPRHIMSLPCLTRRTVVQSMRGANGNFFFDGKQVCTQFLKNGFHFRTDVLSGNNCLSNCLPFRFQL